MRVLSRLYHALRGSVFFSRCAYWSSHTFIRSVLISCLSSLIVGVLWKASHRGINATHCVESEALNRFKSGNRYTRVCLDVLERKPSNRESLFRDPLHMLHARISGSCFPTWTSDVGRRSAQYSSMRYRNSRTGSWSNIPLEWRYFPTFIRWAINTKYRENVREFARGIFN